VMRVAILDDYQNVAMHLADWQSLRPAVQVEAFCEHISDEVELVRRLHGFDGVVLMRERTPFHRSLIECLPKLRLIVTTGMYNGAIDLAAAAERGIPVCGTEALGYPTAELTWALILALSRNIPREDAAIRQNRWQTTLGRGLKGKTLGIIGLGRLGGQVATVGKVFGMKVIGWSQNLTEARASELGVTWVTKEALFEQADVVTIQVLLSERTRALVGAAEFARMKPTAFLINTARGPIVDEAALIEALRTRRIAGAALDVYDREPLPKDHPLLRLDNTVLTPHLGYVIEENYRHNFGQAVENIRAFLDGRPVRLVKLRA
jgi:phosphoglycerate dehydrogenase-like enzyme